MVVRRPLVLSGQFLSEADDNDGKVILGSITYGSGLGQEFSNFEQNYTANSYLTAAPSGLIYVLDGSNYKLAVDGSSQVLAEQALASGNQALTEVEPASASGLESQRIAVEALASGNAALLANLSGIQLSTAAIETATVAYASGQAALTTAASVIEINLDAIASGEYAYGSGVAANEDSAEALSSGNAALNLLAANPFLSSEELVGLIFALG
jgi:hypothetical protein